MSALAEEKSKSAAKRSPEFFLTEEEKLLELPRKQSKTTGHGSGDERISSEGLEEDPETKDDDEFDGGDERRGDLQANKSRLTELSSRQNLSTDKVSTWLKPPSLSGKPIPKIRIGSDFQVDLPALETPSSK